MLRYDKRMESLCVTQERGEGRLTEKVTKSDVGAGVKAKKSDATHSKKQDFASDVLIE